MFTETESERASETKTQNGVVRRDRERHAGHRQTDRQTDSFEWRDVGSSTQTNTQ